MPQQMQQQPQQHQLSTRPCGSKVSLWIRPLLTPRWKGLWQQRFEPCRPSLPDPLPLRALVGSSPDGLCSLVARSLLRCSDRSTERRSSATAPSPAVRRMVGDAISAGFPWSRRRQQHCRCRLQANLYFEVRQLSFKRATCWTADSCLQSQWSKLIACYSLWCSERNDAFRSKWLLFIACA